jgi:hypothetical protein
VLSGDRDRRHVVERAGMQRLGDVDDAAGCRTTLRSSFSAASAVMS